MLPKIYRLPAKVKLKQSTFLKTSLFTLKISGNHLPNNRYGFIVKKSIDKRAVIRNRLRRVLRSCIEEMLENIKTGSDMLFFVEKGIIDRKRDEIYKELNVLLAEKGLLK